MNTYIERKFRKARIWSNQELVKIAPLLEGDVCNVSAWTDEDKEGLRYKDYFKNATSYSITNYEDTNARGYQGNIENEIILDLTEKLDKSLHDKYDIVFNHTTLEHIFEVDTAFKNLCLLSTDVVIIVVPFMQETHTHYGDYWRFTPQAIDKLFKKNNLESIYINYNDDKKNSIYVFAVGSKKRTKHEDVAQVKGNKVDLIYSSQVGTKIINSSFFDKLFNIFSKLFRNDSQ